jgi:hypothetical protein
MIIIIFLVIIFLIIYLNYRKTNKRGNKEILNEQKEINESTNEINLISNLKEPLDKSKYERLPSYPYVEYQTLHKERRLFDSLTYDLNCGAKQNDKVCLS